MILVNLEAVLDAEITVTSGRSSEATTKKKKIQRYPLIKITHCWGQF